MTPRERVLLAINHKEADRVPFDVGSTAAGMTNDVFPRVKKYYGVETPDINSRPDQSASYYNDELLDAIGCDIRHLFLMPPDAQDLSPDSDGIITNEWGLKKRQVTGLFQDVAFPLSESEGVSALQKYLWPDPADKGRVRGLKERAEKLRAKDYAIATRAVSHGFFELAWELRGMEKFFVDMYIDESFAAQLLDKTLEIQMGLYSALLSDTGRFVDIVQTADDYGTQNGLIMSKEMFRKYIKPRRTALNAHIKKLAPSAKISHHTCGSVYAIIPDLIESGVDILNPCQPLASDMDSYKLKKEFGDVLCFHGGIDEQEALPGSLEALDKEIRTRIDAFAPGGGYILASTSNIQDDTPLENIIHYFQKAKEFGVYGAKR